MATRLPKRERRVLTRFILDYIAEANRPVWIDELVLKSTKYISAHEAVLHRRSQRNKGDISGATVPGEEADRAVNLGRKLILLRQLSYLTELDIIAPVERICIGREKSSSYKLVNKEVYEEFVKTSRTYRISAKEVLDKIIQSLSEAPMSMTRKELYKWCDSPPKHLFNNALNSLIAAGKVNKFKVDRIDVFKLGKSK